jgi:uncharacterized membrane protein YoaK (UPF0700 family)
METGMLHLHSILRWVILILLLAALYHAFARKAALKQSSLWLMIASHIMLVVGLYQLIAGRYGITKFKIPEGVELMKDKFLRFYWIEHPLMMFIAIVLITVARAKAKRGSYKNAGWLLLVALLLILAAVPWPFRDVVGETRTWFPGM